jgi:hypothetical protein
MLKNHKKDGKELLYFVSLHQIKEYSIYINQTDTVKPKSRVNIYVKKAEI